MKAITIWQPWASLIAIGAKQYETRSWATNYRGQIAIHAAAKDIKRIYKELFPCSDYEFHPSHIMKEQFCDTIKACGLNENKLPTGCIIATAELVDCYKITKRLTFAEKEKTISIQEMSEKELLFGDWTPGRYAWEIANIKILDKPIRAKGQQRLWNWEA